MGFKALKSEVIINMLETKMEVLSNPELERRFPVPIKSDLV